MKIRSLTFGTLLLFIGMNSFSQTSDTKKTNSDADKTKTNTVQPAAQRPPADATRPANTTMPRPTNATAPRTGEMPRSEADRTIRAVEATREAGEVKEIVLEHVERGGGRPFMEVLRERQSIRRFMPRELEPRHLSGLLWAANGVNREDEGKRTAPTARDAREIDVYFVTMEGIYLYIPEGHRATFIKGGDHRKEILGQKSAFAFEAPIVLVFVANSKKMEKFDAGNRDFYAGVDCGYVSQNVYLYCASENMATVVLGGINKEAIGKILELKNDKVLLAQPVGYKD